VVSGSGKAESGSSAAISSNIERGMNGKTTVMFFSLGLHLEDRGKFTLSKSIDKSISINVEGVWNDIGDFVGCES
jgi:hypothetical protein